MMRRAPVPHHGFLGATDGAERNTTTNAQRSAQLLRDSDSVFTSARTVSAMGALQTNDQPIC